jgi:hypothetical protein
LKTAPFFSAAEHPAALNTTINLAVAALRAPSRAVLVWGGGLTQPSSGRQTAGVTHPADAFSAFCVLSVSACHNSQPAAAPPE